MKEYVNRLPPEAVTLLTVIYAPPAAAVLVSVTIPVPVEEPEGKVIVSGFGAIDTVARAATTVPESDTGEPVTGTLAAIVTVPAAAPRAVAVTGAKTTLIVQLAPAANEKPAVVLQVPPADPVGRENGAVTVMLTPVSAAPPVLLNVSVCDGLVVPRAQVPNASDVGVTLPAGVGGITTSTAPMSTPGPCGREVPKKSIGGAPIALA
jgi:hypothetical protein